MAISVTGSNMDMNDRKLRALSKIEIFQDLSEEEVKEMDRRTTMTTCEPGRVFYAPEETGEVLFLLKSGRVQLYRLSPEGKKLVVAVLEPGAVFGEMSIVGQGMHNTFAEAIDECLICVMSRVDVERLLVNKPQVALRFMESMARRLQDAEEKLEDLAFKSIPSRLAGLLIRLAGSENGRDDVVGYTHQDMAEMLGTYRETTTQTLNEFKNQGWIDIGRKKIRILDREALEAQAQQ
ncbi:MAG: Crp/Fnr family transcriptional regulator [Anaerolineales bacterium]|nr:Crp/Fnr family transcriptional regulator [Anaerolineales bacterium]